MGLVICVADYCGQQRFLTREWAATQPTCYLGVNADWFEHRFVDEPWLCRFLLADIVVGAVDLVGELERLASSSGPVAVRHVSMPVYGFGPLPVPIARAAPDQSARSFVVEMRPEGVLVEGILVVPADGGTRFQVFSALWRAFLADLQNGVEADRFRVQNVETIMTEIETVTGRQVVDEVTVRRGLNRLQSDIGRAIRRELGLAIQREDIVQTCRWRGQGSEVFGYRLNPHVVTVRAPLSPRAAGS